MSDHTQELSEAQDLRLVALSSFRPFSRDEWMQFSGCEAKHPLIAEVESSDEMTGVVIILADGLIEVHGMNLGNLDEARWSLRDGRVERLI